MSQQRYIYPPTTVSGLQALYANPQVPAGLSTITIEVNNNELLYDRAITDILELPNSLYDIQLKPNELANSTTIFKSIELLHENFLYLNTRATLASNDLPGQYKGYYSTSEGDSSLAVYTDALSAENLPILDISEEVPTPLTSAPSLSSTTNGQDLNSLVTGVWLRDNSLIDTTSTENAGENYHYGFLGSSTSLTIVKMSNTPKHLTVEYGPDGQPIAQNGWLAIDRFTNVQDIPGNKNIIEYNNITRIKSDMKNNIYVLDSGESREGITNISRSSQRSVIYKYDVSGYLNLNNNNTIQKNQRILTSTLGDLNTATNESDVLFPVAFTVNDLNHIVLYDEHDYTFKVFDENNNFIEKHPKRATFFRGAAGKEKTYLGISDIHYDTTTSTYYVLTPVGHMFRFDKDFKLVSSFIVDRGTSNESKSLPVSETDHEYYNTGNPGDHLNETFRQLEFSKNEPNTYYILTNHRLIKRFKSREDYDIGKYNFIDIGVGTPTKFTQFAFRASLKFLSIIQDAYITLKTMVNDDNERVEVIDLDRTYTYDQMYIYTDFVDLQYSTINTVKELDHRYILSFQERDNENSCLIDDEYSIYTIDGDTTITHREYTSDLIYNKALYKLLRNHLKMVKLFNYQLAGTYSPTGNLIYLNQRYVEETNHRDMIFEIDENYFVGINEYCSTAVVNRCFRKIYTIQEQLLKNLQTFKTNTWPVEGTDIPIEPYTYTDGKLYEDIDSIPYIGYYYMMSEPSGDIPVAGRTINDGPVLPTGKPSTTRYLSLITTG